MENLGTIVLATGALGTAAFGIVEALKWTWLGVAGFGTIKQFLGSMTQALQVAYGEEWERMLRGQYRGDQSELVRSIRQGVRIGLTEANAEALAKFLGTVTGEELKKAAAEMASGTPSEKSRNVLGRFELAADLRVDAALALANDKYKGIVRMAASFVALAIALTVGYLLEEQKYLFHAVIVGIAAVPLAPMAKDLASALQAATTALRGK